MKSVSYFTKDQNSYLKKILSQLYDLQNIAESPFEKNIDLYIPPGRVCLIEDNFSSEGGIEFAARLHERYSKIIVVLSVNQSITNDSVKKAVSIAHVYRIISSDWPEENILSVMADAFAYSHEIKKNIFLHREEEERQQRLVSNQQALQNEEYLNVESLMYADQIVQYARSSIESYNQILSAIGSGIKSRELLDSIREKINRLVPVDAISLCFRSKRISSTERLNISISYTNKQKNKSEIELVSRKFYERMVDKTHPDSRNKVTNFLHSDEKSSSVCEIVNDEVIASSMLIPLIHQEKYMGILVLMRFDKPTFKKRELLIVEHFSEAGNIIARGFRNFEYYEKTKQEWESTFDAISDPVSIVDTEYNLIRVNKAYVKFSRYTIEAVIGKKCYSVLVGINSPCPSCPLKRAVADREVKNCDELKTADNRIYNVWSYPVVSGNKEINHVVMFYRNIAGEKFLTKQLMEADKMAEIGILAGSVAHEINNPLGGILAFVQIILRELTMDKQDNKQFFKDIKEIEKAAIRGKNIAGSLLNFSRMSRAEEFGVVELDRLIETAISLVAYNASLFNIEFKQDFSDKVSPIFGNSNQLLHVFLCVITNILTALTLEQNKEKHIIHISIKEHDGNLETEISYKGKMFSEEKISKIFNPNILLHEEVDIPEKTVIQKRSGRGLATSYGIIQNHKGSIDVRSDKKKGNIYSIVLPVFQEKASVISPFVMPNYDENE